jgi:hypothetical protein
MPDVLRQSLDFVLVVVIVGTHETYRFNAALAHQNQVFVVMNITVLEMSHFPTVRRGLRVPAGGGHGRPNRHLTSCSVHVGVLVDCFQGPARLRVAQ